MGSYSFDDCMSLCWDFLCYNELILNNVFLPAIMMKLSYFTKLRILMITMLGLAHLSACGHTPTNSSSMPVTSSPTLTLLNTKQLGAVRQFTLDEHGNIFGINEQGQLWHIGTPNKQLADGFSPDIAPVAGYGRVGLADRQGNFVQWIDGKKYPTTIKLATHAGMIALPFATIVITDQSGLHHIARIDTTGRLQAIRQDFAVLPDVKPLQIDLASDNDGHIAVLAKPDTQTYQHGVLGDAIEAGQIRYLERHDLHDLAAALELPNQVFEANLLTKWQKDGRSYLVSTPSGGGNGASTAVIGLNQGKLTILAQSTALPTHRWQSPFVAQGKLYAVQMPHLKRELVRYDWQDDVLTKTVLGNGVSNHQIGDKNTNLTATTNQYTIIPASDYQGLALLQKDETLRHLPIHFDGKIIDIKSSAKTIVILLDNGQIWQLQ